MRCARQACRRDAEVVLSGEDGVLELLCGSDALRALAGRRSVRWRPLRHVEAAGRQGINTG
jgi:hypothetical protein